MTLSDGALIERIEQALGSRVVAADSLPVGFGLTGLVVTLAGGPRAAVKARVGPDQADLRIEASMLQDLRALSKLPVPEVYFAAGDLLIMEFIASGGGITPGAERHAAELIAELHGTPRPYFGYPHDTLIGPLPQRNPEAGRWVPFFREERLLPMARDAFSAGRLPSHYLSRIEALALRLEDYLDEPSFPSLLHGDLWAGNVLVHENRIAAFVDPAIYFGHREIELAFSTMFATFGRAFFDAYEALLPLAPGFHEDRRHLYNLYPALVHVRLFGAGYLAGIDRTLARFGF